MAQYPESPRDFIVFSYRYLRLGIVLLVVTLGISLAIEIAGASCWQGSISAYYYTPVHGVFVGALVAIGVTLVAMKANDSVEDMFFNVAGVLAPVVAWVPTTRPATVCSQPGEALTVPFEGLVTNNVPALLLGVLLAVIVAWITARRSGRKTKPELPRATLVGLALSAVLIGAGAAWYFVWDDSFRRYAHWVAAISMFVAIWFAIVVNAGWPRRGLEMIYRALGESYDDRPDSTPKYRQAYGIVALSMVIVAVAIAATLGIDWDQRVFWIEALEIAPFGVFWLLQTVEYWHRGIGGMRTPGT